jgi:hypothetical protein
MVFFNGSRACVGPDVLAPSLRPSKKQLWRSASSDPAV